MKCRRPNCVIIKVNCNILSLNASKNDFQVGRSFEGILFDLFVANKHKLTLKELETLIYIELNYGMLNIWKGTKYRDIAWRVEKCIFDNTCAARCTISTGVTNASIPISSSPNWKQFKLMKCPKGGHCDKLSDMANT